MVRDEFAFLVINATNLCDADPVRRAVQQPWAELGLKLSHLLGYSRLPDAHLWGSFAERAEVNHTDKNFDALYAVHVWGGCESGQTSRYSNTE